MRAHALFVSLSTLLVLAAVGCSDSGNSPARSAVSLSFSDAPVDGVDAVVITVDKVTFVHSDDAIDDANAVDTFATDSEQLTGNEQFSIDLLSVQGTDSRLVIDSVDLPVGDYSNMLIDVLDEDINLSYVDVAGSRKALKVPSGTLKLGGFSISPQSKQSFVVEFGLQQSMTYNPGPDRYILKPHGVKVVSVDEAAHIKLKVDHNALQQLPGDVCPALELGGTAGDVYLYAADRNKNGLGDNYAPALEEVVEVNLPVSSASLSAENPALTFNEPGNYVIAVRCGNEDDSAAVLQNLTIPSPAGQQQPIALAAGQTQLCNIPLTGAGSCTEQIVETESITE